MERITPTRPWPLYDVEGTRRIEQAAAATLPAHTLMQRAGHAVARLAQALAPHARTIWIACGPGNNGGDGLEAAALLQRAGRQVTVTWLGDADRCSSDTRASWERAGAAGVQWSDTAPPALAPDDLCIDALLGIGLTARTGPSGSRPHDKRVMACLHALRHSPAPVLAVDLPSGLDADTGQIAPGLLRTPDRPTHPLNPRTPPRTTLSLLTLKPGLFTAQGRDYAGEVWFDDLQVAADQEPPCAWLTGPEQPAPRLHDSHKGSHGDVAVIGGEGLAARGMGMTGAAWLAATAALHGGAGRVLLTLLEDTPSHAITAAQPELMLREAAALDLPSLTVVCGCGGGLAIQAVLPAVLDQAAQLVLDADALNAIAEDPDLQARLLARGSRGQATVLTPHPLEAGRLLGLSTAQVQADRLGAAQQLAEQFDCVAVLKGSGTVVAARDRVPAINPTGNGRLATAGTGDVLAGLVGARLAGGASALRAASEAVFAHGLAADQWPAQPALTASALARRLG